MFELGARWGAQPDKMSDDEGSGDQEGSVERERERERETDFKDMGILRCDSCGEEFIIFHDPELVDCATARRQAHWLEKVLAEEHERERKHSDRIQPPD
jgi:hypothetical protein